MKKKSFFSQYRKPSGLEELIQYLNQCSVNPKFISINQTNNQKEQITILPNKIEVKKSKSKNIKKNQVIDRAYLQNEFLKFLITTDGPTSLLYQLEEKKIQTKIQNSKQSVSPRICLSKHLGQYQELVNPF